MWEHYVFTIAAMNILMGFQLSKRHLLNYELLLLNYVVEFADNLHS